MSLVNHNHKNKIHTMKTDIQIQNEKKYPRPYVPPVAETQYIDLTPTWSGLMPALIAAAANGSQGAIDELMRLAAIVDRHNAAKKQAK